LQQQFLLKLAALMGLLLAVACASVPPQPKAPALAPPAASAPSSANVPSAPPPPSRFDLFLAAIHDDAHTQGISEETFAAATAGIAPIPVITAMNDNQPEFSRPVWSYLDGAVSARRIKDGQFMLAKYGDTLNGIAAQSGVSADILLAIWGVETDFGSDVGDFNLFAALATLGYDGPRADYAKPEFLAALKILQDQRYAASEMRASWAGAFGQTQFTPTTFLKYAIDGDHDGRIDLWNSPADALASAANLLSSQGWQAGAGWGYEVKLPAGFAYEDADIETLKPVAEWRRRGVKKAAGTALPASNANAAIYLPAGAHGPAFLLMPNFSVILKYNNAASYALGVAILADRIMGRPAIRAKWPRDEHVLSRDERFAFQKDLMMLGFDPGLPDGVLGRKTRAAARAWQKQHGMQADGWPSASLLAALHADSQASAQDPGIAK
jgi:membrane-bound lytic murein transglycosylase B